MAKTHKRRGLEERLAEMGLRIWATRQTVGWYIRPKDALLPPYGDMHLYGDSLDNVEKIADWLEALGLRGSPEASDEGLSAKSQNAGFLRTIIQDSINALEMADEIGELMMLLGWLKQTIKGLDPDYDVTQDPT